MVRGMERKPTKEAVDVQGVLRAVLRRQEPSQPHLDYFVRELVAGRIPNYQAAAFLAGVFCRGLSDRATVHLTEAMANSGKRLDLSAVHGRTVDKHSTGGISDGTSFIIAPLVTLFGLKVPMMSGRGLGHTGGTLDKLEAIPGFRCSLSEPEVVAQLNTIGLAIFAQTEDMVPADKMLYDLRNATQTVASIPLIAASIMSKKLAEGAQGLVLNVTTGSGAFMERPAEARQLARAMVAIARGAGCHASAVVSSMDQPLAPYVGNALEIRQAIAVLRGETRGYERFIEVSIELAAQLLVHGGVYAATGIADAKAALRARLAAGAAFAPFCAMVAAQGGDVMAVVQPERLPKAERRIAVNALQNSYVGRIDARLIGEASLLLGAGRTTVGAPIDPAVGLHVHKFVGDAVHAGEPLVTLHVNDGEGLAAAKSAIGRAYTLTDRRPRPPRLIYEVMT